ncbi:SAM hydrolase/SAM-dependent halogenase family protein [Megalodesulfovibrio gigas]|uniref:SAM hydrolase/SAM-dependent halogenase family protein n=1 Tax=Megalodesulfovibrio gigas TaxID=879 RepID=UPI00040F20E4|nr:SAM-dependent chlorinase/fluorinase [Megalodesulfovibrio gigas]
MNQHITPPDAGAVSQTPGATASAQWKGRRLATEAIRPVIALLTDFGHADPYVAQMKGAILRRAPHVQLVDISHECTPFRLEQAGFFLQVSQNHFPRGTVFVAVVDPGVGTARRIVCLARDGRLFLAPDNGILTQLLDEPGHAAVFDLTPSAEALHAASRTFHARDLFAPLAARLAQGDSPAGIGAALRLEDVVRLASVDPEQREDGALVLRVLHVDRFGNCILNAPVDSWHGTLAAWARLEVHTADGVAHPAVLANTYAELAEGSPLGVLAGSQGYLELALSRASAARKLGLHPGDILTLAAGSPA